MAIIAGYAGVGKSYFANKMEGAIEIPSMPFRWILPKHTDKTEIELEKEKGAFYHLANPLFPMNYILEILKAEAIHRYVIIPTVEWVLKVLQENYNRLCVLVYPEDSLKEEYRKRYIARGNSESFMCLFVDGWEERLEGLRANKGVHIALAKDEYLSDVKIMIDNIIGERINAPISSVQLEKIEKELFARKRNLILVYFGRKDEYAYRILNIDDDGIQRFLYEVGRFAYEQNRYKPFIVKEDKLLSDDIVWIESKEAFMDVIHQNG